MLATLCVLPIRPAARPKNVLAPVAYTTAWRSPCLIALPLNATSPLNFLAGSDSPVSAAWSICARPGATRVRPMTPCFCCVRRGSLHCWGVLKLGRCYCPQHSQLATGPSMQPRSTEMK